ncbi:MAG TPA: PDZ domain-containing protein, partial [Gemmatimonadales bacterium]|nr:PDZ domain-containing protein [Gemmatimonadales bacterium]
VMQFVMSRRARLGLKVNLQARDTDSVGAYVDAVTPNGPAAKAGIRSGDLITKVDGKSVLAGRQAGAEGQRESLPGLRLIELAAELEPNDTIAVELRRGKEKKSLSVVTADEPNVMFRGDRPDGRTFVFRYKPGDSGRIRIPLGEEDFEGRFGGGGATAFLYGAPLANLELAPLNPDLGQYFGATTGVLVISVPKESELSLKGGDVVLTVDGRKPESPSHLLRILRSYEEGESFKIEVLRNRKRETVSGRLGQKGEEQ